MELLFVKSAIRKSIGVDKMARPKKQTVDYFPHIIKQGKTMTILESKFGNDGYAFWFKLLEILGSTEGHSYRYENPTDIEFLCAKTNVSREKAEEILNLLADLDAIDKKCWENNIIWSDNFIENVADVYSKRSCGVPQKPVFDTDNPNDKEFSNQKPESKEVSGDENPQSKLKESKLKESKDSSSEKSDTESDEFSLSKKDNGRYDYPKDYERLYSLYPYSRGNKKAGWRKWAATRRKGVEQDDLIEAAKNYAANCKKEGTEEKWVMHIKTFLGRDEHWKEYLGGQDYGREHKESGGEKEKGSKSKEEFAAMFN